MSKRMMDMKAKLQHLTIRPSTIDFQKRIGEGAFGEVWLGKVKGLKENPRETTLVAVKMLREHQDDGSSRNEKEINDFLREAEIMSSFNHPRVVRVLGVCIK
jgi:serine/threonine protein kinase